MRGCNLHGPVGCHVPGDMWLTAATCGGCRGWSLTVFLHLCTCSVFCSKHELLLRQAREY